MPGPSMSALPSVWPRPTTASSVVAPTVMVVDFAASGATCSWIVMASAPMATTALPPMTAARILTWFAYPYPSGTPHFLVFSWSFTDSSPNRGDWPTCG